ncbi:hypothetical protein DCAR_0105140 [Daucus carota subsp. sativus]|uniref:Uncharacterized protein n=1 Tax=Daucus carota subsp. sativus TaxID=79200 RepID=A0AAF0WAL2_DAUCS|nr:hypothetical protein DCAR_0105140 [Daucus carota subsp. sativus]
MILANTEINYDEDSVDVHVLPATLIGFTESVQLKKYISSTRKPRAKIIFGGTSIGKSRAPAVAQFSSRGPSFMDPSILKPDMIAPGVNIISAWPQNLGPAGIPEDSRRPAGLFAIGAGHLNPTKAISSGLIYDISPNDINKTEI